jgi:hypothetical protein
MILSRYEGMRVLDNTEITKQRCSALIAEADGYALVRRVGVRSRSPASRSCARECLRQAARITVVEREARGRLDRRRSDLRRRAREASPAGSGAGEGLLLPELYYGAQGIAVA